MAIFTFTHLFLLAFFIVYVGRGFLVDAVVGQMGEDVLHLRALVGVLVGGEPHQTVVVEVESQRVDGGDQQVKPEVELCLVNQIWPGHVSLYYQRTSGGDLTPLIDHFDSFSASQRWGFHDPPALPSFPLPDLPQQLGVRRQAESSRQEIELRFSVFQHQFVVVFPQSVLPADVEGPWRLYFNERHQ